MTVRMNTLVGEEIPAALRRPGLDIIFKVESSDGTVHYLESDIEALQLMIEIDDEERRMKG